MNWHDVFVYQNGELIWRERQDMPNNWNRRFVGKVAGAIAPIGYRVVSVNYKKLYVHRIVWEMHHGQIPPSMQVDHVDRDRLNNRVENLRLATYPQNLQNAKRRSDNSTGFKGVVLDKRRQLYAARIRVAAKQHHLGYFKTPEEAHAAYCAAAEHHFGDFARTA